MNAFLGMIEMCLVMGTLQEVFVKPERVDFDVVFLAFAEFLLRELLQP